MNIVQWKPFSELERLIDDRMPEFPRFGSDLAVDVFEEKGNVIAKLNVPAVKPEELEIYVEDDILTVSGRREEEKEIEKKNYYSKEIRRGSFSRTVVLPKSVDTKKSEAEYKDGVLVVRMPVLAGAKEKAVKVPIKK